MTAAIRPIITTEELDWQLHGQCRGLDANETDETFYADRTSKKTTEFAKRICRTCPVIAECGTWALNNREMYGVWGGMDRFERARILGITITR
jgi:WhiB family transcriptional regulator, redox-sensing transcriptional regulator